MAVQFSDGGPLVGYDPGIEAKVGEDFVPLPKEGDKVTVSAEYWAECCADGWDPSVSGPLRLGDVGEVSSVLPPEANEPAPYTVTPGPAPFFLPAIREVGEEGAGDGEEGKADGKRATRGQEEKEGRERE